MLQIAKSFAVVKFQQTPKPRNYLSRREQWRLLLLVMSLGLVVVLMLEARDPANWQWFVEFGRGAGGTQDEPTAAQGPPIEGRLEPTPDKKPTPGTPISPGPRQPGENATDRYFPGVNPEDLEPIRDDTTFLYEERLAWQKLFEILGKTDEATLRRRSIGGASYTQLFQQSDEYRGALVTVRGTVRRANPIGAPTKDFGTDRYYRAWLFPEDNPARPIVVYCLELPTGFPTGMEVSEQAEITGFFFKRWAYRAVERMHTAPVLAARTLHWQQAPKVVKTPPADRGTLMIVAGVALAVCLFVCVQVYARTRRGRPEEPGLPPQFDALEDIEVSNDVVLPPDRAEDSQPN